MPVMMLRYPVVLQFCWKLLRRMEVLLGEAPTAESPPVAVIRVSPAARRRAMPLLGARVGKATPKTKWKEYSGMALLKYTAGFHSVCCVLTFSEVASREATENSKYNLQDSVSIKYFYTQLSKFALHPYSLKV